MLFGNVITGLCCVIALHDVVVVLKTLSSGCHLHFVWSNEFQTDCDYRTTQNELRLRENNPPLTTLQNHSTLYGTYYTPYIPPEIVCTSIVFPRVYCKSRLRAVLGGLLSGH